MTANKLRLYLKRHYLQVSGGKGALVARVPRYVLAGREVPETEGNDTTSDSELQSSDSEDDPDGSEDHAQSHCLEMDDSVEHGCEVPFVPDADVEHVTVHTKQVVNSSIIQALTINVGGVRRAAHYFWKIRRGVRAKLGSVGREA